jgi:hypothetical protein
VRASAQEVAVALAGLTGEDHPLAAEAYAEISRGLLGTRADHG